MKPAPKFSGGMLAALLAWLPVAAGAANVVQTASPVAIQFGTHQLHGRGLRVALNDGILRLESNVNGTFSP